MYLFGFGIERQGGRSLGSGLVLNGEFGCGESWLEYSGGGSYLSGLGICMLVLRLPALLSPI